MSPRRQPGHAFGGRDPREGRAGRGGAHQWQGDHERKGGGEFPEDKRVGVQEDGAEATATRSDGAAVHLPAERAPCMAHGTLVTTRGPGWLSDLDSIRTN